MCERASFLQSIREAPEDEVVRKVFADWLDEHDDPLGEFIRLQFNLEPVRDDLTNTQADTLRQHEEKMLRQYRRKWLGKVAPLAQEGSNGQVKVIFRRGFVETCWLSPKLFLELGEALLAQCPALHEIVLHDLRGQAGAGVVDSPLLDRVNKLTVTDWLSAKQAKMLATSSRLTNVWSLTVWLGHRDEEAVLRALAGSANFPALREVRLVQLHGGIQAGNRSTMLARKADELANQFNHLRGERIARVERPFTRRFPLRGDIGYGPYAGHLAGNQPVLAFPGDRFLVLIRFDEQGNYVEVRHEKPCCDQDDLEDRLRDSFGFEPGLIRVHEFATNPRVPRRRAPWFFTTSRRPKDEDIALCQWGYFDASVVEAPDTPADGYSLRKWRQDTARIHGWMHAGNFILDCWNDYWVDHTGTICAS